MSGVSREEIFFHIIEIIESYDPLEDIPTCSEAWAQAPELEKETSIFIRTMIEEIAHSKPKLLGSNVTEH
jgi:hypothetical protein